MMKTTAGRISSISLIAWKAAKTSPPFGLVG